MEEQEKVESSTLMQNGNEEEKNNDNEAINFVEDPPCEMTDGRRIALWLMQYKWYNPQQLPREQELVKKDDNEEENEGGEIVMKEESDELVEPLLERQNKTKEGKDDDEEKAERREIPSLEKAWAFFEHVTMPRYMYRPEDGEYPNSLDRAQVSKKKHKKT